MKVLLSVFAAASMTAGMAHWTTPPPAFDYVVRVVDNGFIPETVEVNFGDRVIWKNFDTHDHTVTAQFGPADPQEKWLFDSGLIGSGGSFEFIFVKEGTYKYTCDLHPGIVGKVVVRR
ncbi:MAG: cupredoxin domain-containing protein [Planctomycetaceae bacterium]|nr:cupredoxin domain-containing protein [Planctomycetaceae bacterium]